MRVKDIMLPVHGVLLEKHYHESRYVLHGDIRIPEVDINQILPERVAVINDANSIVGYVERDTLIFIRNKCHQNLFSRLADKYNDGVIMIDAEGRIFFVNDSYSKILGVAKSAVLGRQLQKVEPGAEMLTVLKTKKEIIDKQVHVKSINKHVTVNIYPLVTVGQLLAVLSIFRDVTETKKLTRELDRAQEIAEYFRQKLLETEKSGEKQIIGNHPVFLQSVAQAMIVAKTDAPVLIYGESGVGKEILAKLIHRESSRQENPMITVNCAAIPDNLLESELFGYEEGSFTGALRGGKLGKFELARGGTIFLDEIGDMPATMQPKILRVLQEGEIEKIGRMRGLPVDVRILAATNQPLQQMVKEGRFRNDLYYRLNVVAIRVPPLRERGDDLVLLARYFLDTYNGKYSKKLSFANDALAIMYEYKWPGNVRELQNCIERAVIMCFEEQIHPEHFPGYIVEIRPNSSEDELETQVSVSLKAKVSLLEKEMIEKILTECRYNKSAAMQKLGISRRTFYNKLRKYNILL